MVEKLESLNMSVLIPNLCYNKVCYKGAALYMNWANPWYFGTYHIMVNVWLLSWGAMLKGYIGAVTCDFQQCGILTSVDSGQPVQPPFKLTNSKWCSVSSLTLIEYSSDKQRLNTHRIFKWQAKALIRLCVCTDWSEALLVAHTTLLEISCHSSYLMFCLDLPLLPYFVYGPLKPQRPVRLYNMPSPIIYWNRTYYVTYCKHWTGPCDETQCINCKNP